MSQFSLYIKAPEYLDQWLRHEFWDADTNRVIFPRGSGSARSAPFPAPQSTAQPSRNQWPRIAACGGAFVQRCQRRYFQLSFRQGAGCTDICLQEIIPGDIVQRACTNSLTTTCRLPTSYMTSWIAMASSVQKRTGKPYVRCIHAWERKAKYLVVKFC